MKIRSELTLRKIGDDYLIVEPDQGMVDFSRVFSLNHTAAYLFTQLQGKEFEIESAQMLLKERYGITEDVADRDSKTIIGLFRKENLLYP